MRALALAAMLVALVSCDATRSGDADTVCVFGWLTQKGAPPGTFWAITERDGTVWELVGAAPAELEQLAAAANTQIAVAGVAIPGGIFSALDVGRIGGTCGELGRGGV